MAAAIFRAVALGLLVLAIILNVVGFVTNSWIHAKLDNRGIEDIMSANNMGSQQIGQMGMEINLGLWKFCMQVSLGPMAGGGANVDTCQSVKSKDVPGWMKAVQAFGILSLLAAVLGVATIIYSFFGDSKGDRARLLPNIIAGICVLAGMLSLVGVTVYGCKYNEMMRNQMSMLGSQSPAFSALAENVKENTSLGYSFILDTVSGVLMVLVSLVLFVPTVCLGSARNLAV